MKKYPFTIDGDSHTCSLLQKRSNCRSQGLLQAELQISIDFQRPLERVASVARREHGYAHVRRSHVDSDESCHV